jgi:acyl carrier protein
MSLSDVDTTQARLQEWLCQRLAVQLKVANGAVDPAMPMSSYGLDSLTAIAVLTDVEEHVGFEIDPGALWEYPTVAEFTRVLADRLVPADS